MDKGTAASYAGTSQRHSQRIVCSEAVNQHWDIYNTDISKAFLQGITYKELQELTGEPLREVNFYLPPWCVPIIRRIKGWESFDPLKEVIHCDKPGTGCFDAPRCFSLKLAKVTGETCGMVSCIVDNELCILHQNGKLLALMAKHVDDLKITGETEAVKHLIRKIQEIFG